MKYLGAFCLNPPTPDASHKLQLEGWNDAAPPRIGESITYR